MSGYPNTTDHEDIPPRIGATEKLAVDSDSQGGQWRRVKQTPASTNQKVGRIFAEMANLWLLETCDSAGAQLTPSRDQTAHRPCQRMASMPGQTGKRGRKQPVGRKLPRLPPTHTHTPPPTRRSCHLRERQQGRERARDTAETATEQKRKRGGT